MRILIPVIVFLAFALAAGAGEIAIRAAAEQAISAEILKAHAIVPLDAAQAARLPQILRAWVSGSMDFNQARKRVRQRNQRTSFTQEVTAHVLRLPTERLDLKGPEPKLPAIPRQSVPLAAPEVVLYREGPAQFHFQWMATEKRALRAIPDAEAIDLARGFVLGNALVETTPSDQIGAVRVLQRRTQEEGGDAAKADASSLVEQDVLFERLYQGKPVINSKIIIGFQSDTRDIILLKHISWTLARDAGARRLGPEELKAAGSDSAAAITERIRARILQTCGQAFLRADVVKAVPGWFQTPQGLLPVLVFEAQVQIASPRGPLTEPSLEAINLAGSDDALYGEQGADQAPREDR